MQTKRPALSSILGAGRPLTADAAPSAPAMAVAPSVAEAPSTAPSAVPTTSTKAEKATRTPKKQAVKEPSRRSAGHVQLNVLLPESLRKAAKLRALQEDRDLSEVIETLLRRWLGN